MNNKQIEITKRNSCEKIISSFKELVIIKGFNHITTTEICQDAKVSRKTFYSYFQDKNDIVEKIVLNNVIHPLISINSFVARNEVAGEMIIEWVYKQFYSDKLFYEKIIDYKGQNSLQECIIQHTTEIILNNIKDISISEQEKEYMSYYFSCSHALLLVRWIQNKMDVPPKEMARYYDKWLLSFWKQFYAIYT